MENSSQQNESDAQRPASFLVRLPVVDGLFKWLTTLIGPPTQEEQEDAGVYLGGEGRD